MPRIGTDRTVIEGSLLDPDRSLGEYERIAVRVLGEPLVQHMTTEEDRHRRAEQMNKLYQEQWSLADIGNAFDFSSQWVRMEMARYGFTVMPANQYKRYARKRYPK